MVLDNVDEKFNFEEVLGNPKSFASGSRFIVTSREITVLGRLSEGQSKLYEVQGMNAISTLVALRGSVILEVGIFPNLRLTSTSARRRLLRILIPD
ncbi:hypothetical protein LINPERPRIM_LOCUS16735 [Linum perenne]